MCCCRCCPCCPNDREEEEDDTQELRAGPKTEDEEEKPNGKDGENEQKDDDKDKKESEPEKIDECPPSKYFLSMTRKEVFMWYLGSLMAAFRCCKTPKDYRLIHHRNCYGLF